MAPRSSWKGFIKLSLVSVPVKAYTSTQSGADIRLNQLHAECNSRIKYQKTCPNHGEISNDEIVSGYEFAKGQYVVVDPDEVQKLRKQSDSSVEIEGFIPAGEVDPLYYSGRTYYLVPDGPVGQKPYALFRHGMNDGEVVAFGQIILSGKQQKVLLRVIDGMIAMTVLQYAEKVKRPQAFEDEIQEPTLSEQELALTKTLIEASRIADFDYTSFKDEYVSQMTELIQLKVEGKEIVEVTEADEPQIINLMDALKESIANAMGTGTDGPADVAPAASKSTKTKTAKSTKTRSRSRSTKKSASS